MVLQVGGVKGYGAAQSIRRISAITANTKVGQLSLDILSGDVLTPHGFMCEAFKCLLEWMHVASYVTIA